MLLHLISLLLFSFPLIYSFSSIHIQDTPSDKVMEAARLCLDYCNDPEGAISILSAAQRCLPALQLALRYARKDLFEEVKYKYFVVVYLVTVVCVIVGSMVCEYLGKCH